jgi:uncharacterized protein YfbU (UPF0304 family)
VLKLRILEFIDENNKNDYKYSKEVLENGYTNEYNGILKFYLKEEFAYGKFVKDVLSMYLDIIDSFDGLTDKEKKVFGRIIFPGFHGGVGELRYLEYAEFLINNVERFKRLINYKNRTFDYHLRMKKTYEIMLIKYNELEIDSKRNMSLDTIKELLDLQFEK